MMIKERSVQIGRRAISDGSWRLTTLKCCVESVQRTYRETGDTPHDGDSFSCRWCGELLVMQVTPDSAAPAPAGRE